MNNSDCKDRMHCDDRAKRGNGSAGRGYYGNFQDPLGVVFRMLRAHDKAAHSALYREGLKLPFRALDRLMEPLEARRLGRSGTRSPSMVLIVGPPRSGTTLVYQVLSQYLPVSFFDNWGAMFPRSTITASTILKRYSGRPPNAFESFYGNTAGFRGVNDGFHVWNRWLGNNRYSVPEELDSETEDKMKRFFSAWDDTFDLPLLNKNNRNTFCMSLLASVLESAIFVVVSREPVYIAQSLLLAREQIQGDPNIGWGLGADRPHDERSMSPLEDVADQVRFVFEQMHDQLARVPADRVVHTSYESFCEDPGQLVKQVDQILRNRLPGIESRYDPSSANVPGFRNADSVKLPQHRFDRLKALLQDVPHVASS